LLLDRFIPHGDFSERHDIGVDAPATTAWNAVRNVDLGEDPIIRGLLKLRGMRPGKRLSLDDVSQFGFVMLGEEPGVEIVLGVVGKFWRPTGNVHPIEAERFTRFDDEGFAKAAWNFRVIERNPSRSLVVTHTRVVCNDAGARRSFRRYWLFVRPFSGLIRRRALSRIKRDAERATMTPPS
jgi:hypothetical protein